MKSINMFISIFADLFMLIFPTRKNVDYRFAFIVHPRSRRDVERKFPFFKYIPDYFANFVTRNFWPLTLSKITGLRSEVSGREIEGYVISVLPTARQMTEDRGLALKNITRACKLAERRGAKIIGLGGLTSSFSRGGLDLVDKIKVNLTTGHAYTSYNVTKNLFALVNNFNLEKERLSIGIVGAAGSIGSTSAKILAREGYAKLMLVDLERKKENCHKLKNDIFGINPDTEVQLSHQIKDIITCDIVIAATNAPEALIQSRDLKWGAIVIDDAQPSDVHPDVFLRQDVLVIEAGVTHTPGIKSNFNFGLKDKYDNFCCLAEVLILASNEWSKNYVINRASLELVDEISRLGKKLNFSIGKFQNFNEVISKEKMEFVNKCIHEYELTT
jgi:fatty aldehyde-generating acyl-ACP reductase